MKITYVIDVLDTNLAGTENQLIKLIGGLDKTRFEIELLALRPHAWLSENRDRLGCPTQVMHVEQFRRPGAYLNLLRLVRHFRRTRPDVVHTFFPVSNIVAVIAARCAGVRHVVSSRRDYGEWMSGRYLALTKLANRCAERIVANSPSVKALTVAREGVGPDRVDVYLNGIDVDTYTRVPQDRELKRRLRIPGAARVVGIVANFRPMKHHETFIRAAAEIVRVRDDVHFLLVGGTHSTLRRKQAMEMLANELGIGHKLHFAGVQTDVRPYLSIMDVAVNCSEREGLSNAVMEYMTARVPTVVSRNGGNVDLISEDREGLTFELDDHTGLARQVLRLLGDAGLAERLAGNARQKIETQMSTTTMLRHYADFYDRLVQAGRP